jgi:hypothetical protein
MHLHTANGVSTEERLRRQHQRAAYRHAKRSAFLAGLLTGVCWTLALLGLAALVFSWTH